MRRSTRCTPRVGAFRWHLPASSLYLPVRALGSWQWHSSWPWCREQTRLLAPFVTNRLKHSGPLFLHWSRWRYLYHYGGVPHRTTQNQPMPHPRPNQSLHLTAGRLENYKGESRKDQRSLALASRRLAVESGG